MLKIVSGSHLRNERLSISSVCINTPEREEGFSCNKTQKPKNKSAKKTLRFFYKQQNQIISSFFN